MALKFANNNSLSAITSTPSGVGGGALSLISTTTASNSSSIDITSGLDSSFKEYIIKLINIHPATDGVNFTFNGSDDTSSHSYNITKTTTAVRYYHSEGGANGSVSYNSSTDLSQSTSDFRLNHGTQLGNDNDQSFDAIMHLYNPADTTFTKHFEARTQMNSFDDYSAGAYVGGYFNSTAAITAVQFKMSSGNIESGTIKLYGVS